MRHSVRRAVPTGDAAIDLRREVSMIYKVALHRSEEGYSVTVPGLPGCCSQGATEAEALENIADAIREYLEVAAELAAEAEARVVEVAV
jgi:predicted RNase H-like HicB family nuclease